MPCRRSRSVMVCFFSQVYVGWGRELALVLGAGLLSRVDIFLHLDGGEDDV